MAIPSEQEFMDAMKALARPLRNSVLERFSCTLIRDPDRSKAIAFIEEVFKEDSEQLAEAQRLPALKWLQSDPMINRAKDSFQRDLISISHAERAERLYERLHSRTLEYTGDSVLRWTKVQDEKDKSGSFTRYWPIVLLHAFWEYHYKSPGIKVALETQKQLKALAQTAISGADALMMLEVAALSAKQGNFSPYGPSLEKIKRRRDSDVRRVERFLDASSRALLPIKRNDFTAKERMLVYKLWLGHSAMMRHHKPRAIQLVLLAEGVKNQIDERNVVKMCASFKKRHRTDIAGHMGHLLAEIRGEKYREEIRGIFENSLREEQIAKIGPQLPLAEDL